MTERNKFAMTKRMMPSMTRKVEMPGVIET